MGIERRLAKGIGGSVPMKAHASLIPDIKHEDKNEPKPLPKLEQPHREATIPGLRRRRRHRENSFKIARISFHHGSMFARLTRERALAPTWLARRDVSVGKRSPWSNIAERIPRGPDPAHVAPRRRAEERRRRGAEETRHATPACRSRSRCRESRSSHLLRPPGLAPRRRLFMGLPFPVLADVSRATGRDRASRRDGAGAAARAPGPARVVDMCCGSGNLAIALAHHAPAMARVIGCDLTASAVSAAAPNAERLGVADRVEILFRGEPVLAARGPLARRRVDLVVANPPYISTGRLATDRAHLLESEPREAFDGGPYGISILQGIVRDAPRVPGARRLARPRVRARPGTAGPAPARPGGGLRRGSARVRRGRRATGRAGAPAPTERPSEPRRPRRGGRRPPASVPSRSADIPEVAALVPARSSAARPERAPTRSEAYLERLFVAPQDRTPGIASLVHTREDGAVNGFIGGARRTLHRRRRAAPRELLRIADGRRSGAGLRSRAHG